MQGHELGSLQTKTANLFAKVVARDGNHIIQLQVFEPSDPLKQGVTLNLNEDDLNRLIDIIIAGESVIHQLRLEPETGATLRSQPYALVPG